MSGRMDRQNVCCPPGGIILTAAIGTPSDGLRQADGIGLPIIFRCGIYKGRKPST
jgi:hypothetical protein